MREKFLTFFYFCLYMRKWIAIQWIISDAESLPYLDRNTQVFLQTCKATIALTVSGLKIPNHLPCNLHLCTWHDEKEIDIIVTWLLVRTIIQTDLRNTMRRIVSEA